MTQTKKTKAECLTQKMLACMEPGDDLHLKLPRASSTYAARSTVFRYNRITGRRYSYCGVKGAPEEIIITRKL